MGKLKNVFLYGVYMTYVTDPYSQVAYAVLMIEIELPQMCRNNQEIPWR